MKKIELKNNESSLNSKKNIMINKLIILG